MYIVVEGEDPGFDIFVNGRALARHEDALERLALRLGVKPLIEFFSADENSMSLLIEEGAGNPELMRRLPPPQWYVAGDGLANVNSKQRRRPARRLDKTEQHVDGCSLARPVGAEKAENFTGVDFQIEATQGNFR